MRVRRCGESGAVLLVADPRGRYPIGQRGRAIGAREKPVFRTSLGDRIVGNVRGTHTSGALIVRPDPDLFRVDDPRK